VTICEREALRAWQTFVGAEAIGGEGPRWGIASRRWSSIMPSWHRFQKMKEKQEQGRSRGGVVSRGEVGRQVSIGVRQRYRQVQMNGVVLLVRTVGKQRKQRTGLQKAEDLTAKIL
jgi:hypothetical protein